MYELFKPEPVEHQVGEKKFKFYPVTVGFVLDLKHLAKPLSKALTLFIDANQDNVSKSYRSVEGDEGGWEETTQAISPELAAQRSAAKVEAVESLIDSATSQDGIDAIYRLLMDSLQDDISRGDSDDPAKLKEFQKSVPVTMLPGLVFGALQANAELLGPLVHNLTSKMKEAAKLVGDKFEERLRQLDPSKSEGGRSTSSAGSTGAAPSTSSDSSPSHSSSNSTKPASVTTSTNNEATPSQPGSA